MKKGIAIILVFVVTFGVLVLGNNLLSEPVNVTAQEMLRAEDWKYMHPDIYKSYLANSEMEKTRYGGSVPIDYLEEHPNLLIFYDGFGFSKEYLRARGHTYALEDAINTARPKPGASCLACKTADFTEALAEGGLQVNTMDFQQFVDDHPEMHTISCYDCHRNTAGEVNLTRSHLTKALEKTQEEIDMRNLACAQCHVEYYQESESKEVILPWKYGFSTDDMLEYYDEIEFKDWVHPTSGANLLKVQHPEFETYYGSGHYNLGLSCSDCHMPEIEGKENLQSHHWTSPLKSQEGLMATCATCHGDEPEDRILAVEKVQKAVFERTNEVSDKLAEFIERLSEAVEDNSIKGKDLDELRDIHRKAQFKWDFVFVENGEGFHNSDLAHENLNGAEDLIEEGIKILEKYNK